MSTEGSDAWSGTLAKPNGQQTDGPFATLQQARDAVPNLRKRPGSDVLGIGARRFLSANKDRRVWIAGFGARRINGDFRLKPDSPALKLGFVPLDLSKVGLVEAASTGSNGHK